jgi:hypothetical protein
MLKTIDLKLTKEYTVTYHNDLYSSFAIKDYELKEVIVITLDLEEDNELVTYVTLKRLDVNIIARHKIAIRNVGDIFIIDYGTDTLIYDNRLNKVVI